MKIALLIQQHEGWSAGPPPTKSYWNNNPGNMRYETMLDALEREIAIHAKRGETVRQFILGYAPPNENDTDAYIAAVSAGLGVAPDTLLSYVITLG
jgi:hypothetical protein